ncbi:hypothetical protein VTK73DRAFT_9973 [Phialemonium thermophilum]|uniref:Uncharacterized protein n=1 Tax=Phialemonium thermophilum TaxID=223376 RepID=A0ABR3VZ66_9PEZI
MGRKSRARRARARGANRSASFRLSETVSHAEQRSSAVDAVKKLVNDLGNPLSVAELLSRLEGEATRQRHPVPATAHGQWFPGRQNKENLFEKQKEASGELRRKAKKAKEWRRKLKTTTCVRDDNNLAEHHGQTGRHQVVENGYKTVTDQPVGQARDPDSWSHSRRPAVSGFVTAQKENTSNSGSGELRESIAFAGQDEGSDSDVSTSGLYAFSSDEEDELGTNIVSNHTNKPAIGNDSYEDDVDSFHERVVEDMLAKPLEFDDMVYDVEHPILKPPPAVSYMSGALGPLPGRDRDLHHDFDASQNDSNGNNCSLNQATSEASESFLAAFNDPTDLRIRLGDIVHPSRLSRLGLTSKPCMSKTAVPATPTRIGKTQDLTCQEVLSGLLNVRTPESHVHATQGSCNTTPKSALKRTNSRSSEKRVRFQDEAQTVTKPHRIQGPTVVQSYSATNGTMTNFFPTLPASAGRGRSSRDIWIEYGAPVTPYRFNTAEARQTMLTAAAGLTDKSSEQTTSKQQKDQPVRSSVVPYHGNRCASIVDWDNGSSAKKSEEDGTSGNSKLGTSPHIKKPAFTADSLPSHKKLSDELAKGSRNQSAAGQSQTFAPNTSCYGLPAAPQVAAHNNVATTTFPNISPAGLPLRPASISSGATSFSSPTCKDQRARGMTQFEDEDDGSVYGPSPRHINALVRPIGVMDPPQSRPGFRRQSTGDNSTVASPSRARTPEELRILDQEVLAREREAWIDMLGLSHLMNRD